MLTPFVKLPPDPPEKWKTVKSALETTAKTPRLSLILVASSSPFVLAAVLIFLASRH